MRTPDVKCESYVGSPFCIIIIRVNSKIDALLSTVQINILRDFEERRRFMGGVWKDTKYILTLIQDETRK